ncbi:pyridine nucleotide-disulfide oxidoreductase [Microbulbifer sp. A4B17]|uniref:NAD(P)-binding domain-containing protein n=1 Tax=Microbulbifer sp. A4B17 TaxID=359370 RepID=UPI000D52CFDF|nr:NAD(P)-binding domain-containing protein [Microbulbifer sp. A4B17]AWF80208.1 pyridine nucleotide-disulfide oxidoreductase [Microbulbifer sp. A4B17]
MKYTVIILGAGPGGLQLAHFLENTNIDYLVLERHNEAGSFFRKLPRGRRLISINKPNTGFENYEKNLRWDWNSLLGGCEDPPFSDYDNEFYPNADSIVRYLNDFTARHFLKVRFGEDVEEVTRQGDNFRLRTGGGNTFSCDYLVVGTGVSKTHNPPFSGADLIPSYTDYSMDPAVYTNKRVLVIGKGNSAFETANYLLPFASHLHLISPNYLRSAAYTHFSGDLRSINATFLDTFFLKQQGAVLNGTIESITPVGEGYEVQVTYTENSMSVTLYYDRVIKATGFSFDTSIFSSECMPDIAHEERLPDITCEWESTNVKKMFFVGTLMQGNDYKKSASTFIAGIRYNARALGYFLRKRITGEVWPVSSVPCKGEELYKSIFSRIHNSSSLWHLFGCMCDAYVYDPEGKVYLHYRNIPNRVVDEQELFKGSIGFTLQFGYHSPRDPQERKKFDDHGFIHPIVCLWNDGQIKRESHMLLDVHAEWEDMNFFGKSLQHLIEECHDSLPDLEPTMSNRQ